MNNDEIICFDYPNTLMDEGYPTDEALEYIKNWAIVWGRNGDGNIPPYLTKVGKYFSEGNYEELIEYIRSIWTYNDAITYENGLLEIHTYGWSGNEDIIRELKNTNLWLTKFRCHQTGGHYYFKLDDSEGYDWQVTKIKED